MVDVWVDGVGAVVAVGLVALMAVVVGAPSWWVSLLVTAAVVAVAVIVGARSSSRPGRPLLTVAVSAAVLAAAGGLVGVAVAAWSDARSVDAARTEVARIGATTVCSVLDRGSPERQSAALAASTGVLADRLRSGATVLGSGAGEATCAPVATAVADASADAVEVLALVDVTTDGGRGTRAVSADLHRVDGRWAVASLQVVR
ncbi:MAG: hypothetical protein PGN29_19750 [Gordonia paraffinivorans]